MFWLEVRWKAEWCWQWCSHDYIHSWVILFNLYCIPLKYINFNVYQVKMQYGKFLSLPGNQMSSPGPTLNWQVTFRCSRTLDACCHGSMVLASVSCPHLDEFRTKFMLSQAVILAEAGCYWLRSCVYLGCHILCILAYKYAITLLREITEFVKENGSGCGMRSERFIRHCSTCSCRQGRDAVAARH